MVKGFMNEAQNAIRGEIEYHKIVLRNSRLRAKHQRMITSYFRVLDNSQKTK
jgi:hypothetical protein